MKRSLDPLLLTFVIICTAGLPACTTVRRATPPTRTEPQPVAATSPAQTASANQVAAQMTLPLLDALLAQPSFVIELKGKLQLTDDQIDGLRRVAKSEIERLRESNAEQREGNATVARTLAMDQTSELLGDEKAKLLAELVDNFRIQNNDDLSSVDNQPDVEMSPQPNAVPGDTRVVVNIPAYRMDLFKDGLLVKSYKIGIGYPEFPLPQGLRMAQSVIFNPTWTPPDSPWVATMKDVSPGQRVEAGSSLNPLGPIKIPIGMPSLIHGGKPATKIGHFASHGCVGLTNSQVRDFARLLTDASGTKLSDQTIASFLANKAHTRVVKLNQPVPVELRYETIVVEDGHLHIYKDVYEENSNTEANLSKVLEANGIHFESLSEVERKEVLAALNSMSAHPSKAGESNAGQTNAKKSPRAARNATFNNRKEIVVDLELLGQKGYPAPVNLDSGNGTSRTTALATQADGN